MGNSSTIKKIAIGVLFCAMFFPGQGGVVDAPQTANAAAKTKTVVFFIGSIASTTAVSSPATTTMTFVISLPDMVPTAQPIRSAYISYNAWENTTTGITASSFTLNKQGGAAQTLTGPKLSGGSTEQQLSVRLDATAAMRTLIGSASGTYAMTFTAKLTGPSRMAEGAELYITYDYDPLAPIQVNTVYHWVYSSSTILGTTAVTSPTFNFNLPEITPTTTFAVGASSTNNLWIEYRGFISTGTVITASVGWNSEATSAAMFAETTQQFSFLILSAPKTANVVPSTNNTFKMISSGNGGIVAPNALAIATYSFNFASSTKLQKTIQVPLMQSNSTAATTTVTSTTPFNIPESTPSSTDAFVMGRLAFSTSSAPGMNAYATTSASCGSFPTTTSVATTTQQTSNSGYLTALWSVTPSTTIAASGNWKMCSTFTRNAIANIPGMELFLTYNYNNVFSGGSRFNTNLSFLAQSNMTTSTASRALGVNVSAANASTTNTYSWLDSEFDNNAAGTNAQSITLGIGATTNSYSFPARGTARRQGATFSATSSLGFLSNITTTIQCSVACINDIAFNEFGSTDMIPANLTQAHYHWRNDDGSETGATAQAPEDTSTSTFMQSVDRLRIGINNAGDATSSAAFRLEYQLNTTSGAWTQLATTSIGSAAWQMSTSSVVTDGTPTTNIATSTGGDTDANIFFDPGEVVATTSRNQTVANILSGTQFSDIEFAIRSTAYATPNAPYYFRVSNAGSALSTYAIYPSITVIIPAPIVVNMVLHNATLITLTPNATTSVAVVASTTDPLGAGNIAYATGTIYRTSLGNNCTANNLNCYQIPSSSCALSGSTSTVTCSAGLWYFAQSTNGASSSFSGDSWTGAITVTNKNGGTATATSTVQNVDVLTAISLSTSSVNYGSLTPNTNTGSTNQVVGVQNAGNSSTTLQVWGTAFVNGGNTIATSSQHYSITSFTFGGGEQLLSDTQTTIPGFFLSAPTSTTAVSSNLYWGDAVPFGIPKGTYTATTNIVSVFASTPSMSVTLNTTNTTAFDQSSTTSSNYFNVDPGGSNTVAFACVTWSDAAGISVSSITYNGNAMTAAGPASYNAQDGPDYPYAQVFYLANPPTGWNDLTVTFNTSATDIYTNLISFDNVDQTTPIRPGTYQNPINQSSTSGGTYSMTISSNPSDLTMTCLNGGTDAAPTTNQTLDASSQWGTTQEENDHATNAGSTVTHIWTGPANEGISIVGFSIQ